jgi:hypothetical protein
MSSRVINSMLGFSLLALVISGCGTATGAAVGCGLGRGDQRRHWLWRG